MLVNELDAPSGTPFRRFTYCFKDNAIRTVFLWALKLHAIDLPNYPESGF
jgi:hypothetical protein